MMYPTESRRQANPIRLALARELGRDIDGAWWPRTERITDELGHLVEVLTPLLADITSINVNWSPLQRPPDLNWPGWEHKRQHVMTVRGRRACATLLMIPHGTQRALALMVLRRAADLPIPAAQRATSVFHTASSILQVAHQQLAVAMASPHPPSVPRR